MADAGADEGADADDGHPLDGQAVLLAGAKASVPLSRLPDLLATAAAHLAGAESTYERRYERVHADDDAAVYLVEEGHWRTVGAELGFESNERDAVRRAHAEHLLFVGRREGREAEFASATELREVVVLSTPERSDGNDANGERSAP